MKEKTKKFIFKLKPMKTKWTYLVQLRSSILDCQNGKKNSAWCHSRYQSATAELPLGVVAVWFEH